MKLKSLKPKNFTEHLLTEKQIELRSFKLSEISNNHPYSPPSNFPKEIFHPRLLSFLSQLSGSKIKFASIINSPLIQRQRREQRQRRQVFAIRGRPFSSEFSFISRGQSILNAGSNEAEAGEQRGVSTISRWESKSSLQAEETTNFSPARCNDSF